MTATGHSATCLTGPCDSLPAVQGKGHLPRSRKSAGCVVVISHDRWFLDRVATHILAFEGDSKVTFFDSTARAGVRRTRRGLPCLGQRERGQRWAASIASTTRGPCSRNFREPREWRTQELGDAATRPHRTTYTKLIR